MKNTKEITEKYKNSLVNIPDEQLINLKNKAIADEDYDKAKEIKQEQERRKMQEIEQIKSNDEMKRWEEITKEIKDEKNTYEVQKKGKLKLLSESLQKSEDKEDLWDGINISDEEIDAIIDLTEKIRQIDYTYTYGDYLRYSGYNKEFDELKNFDIKQKKEYFKKNKIQSRADFYIHVLDYFFEELRLVVEKYNLRNHKEAEEYLLDDTLNSLKLFCEKFIDTDKKLSTNKEINEYYYMIEKT